MKRNLLFIILLITLLALPIFTACAKPAPTEVIKLRYYCYALPTEPLTMGGFYLCDYIEQKSGGRVTFERLSGGTLGSAAESLSLVQKGSVDVVTFPLPPYANVFPLHNYPSQIMVGSGKAGAEFANYMEFENSQSSALLQQEWTKNNIKYLSCQAGTTYGIMSRIVFNSLADLKDKKVGLMDPRGAYSKMGLTEVNVKIPDMYEGLSRGLVDCVQFSVAGMVAMKFYEAGKCLRTDSMYPVNSGPHFVNLDVWNKLPNDIQKIFTSGAEAAQKYSIELNAETQEKNLQIIKDAGVDVGELPEIDQLELTEALLALRKADAMVIAEKAGTLNDAKLIWEIAEKNLKISVPLP